MEKKSGDSFHYYHFLRSAAESEKSKEAGTPAAAEPASAAKQLFNQIAG
jgi:hypothetical protein